MIKLLLNSSWILHPQMGPIRAQFKPPDFTPASVAGGALAKRVILLHFPPKKWPISSNRQGLDPLRPFDHIPETLGRISRFTGPAVMG
jgi:hypothetical protein